MPTRYFNWKLASVCVIGLAVLGATAFVLRQWQRSHRAERARELGYKAYDEHNWQEAARDLGRYLAVAPDDVSTLLKYADAQLNIRPLRRNNVQQAIAAYRAVLRVDKDDSEAAIQLSEIYLGMGMPGESELIVKRALEAKPGQGGPELRRMLAVAMAGQRKFDEAAAELKTICTEHPEQILAYETLGQLTEQGPEGSPQSPVYWFNEAVKNNPTSALAYVIRAGFYLRSKDRVGALADLEQAEKLDLSDPVVRLRLAREFINANVLDKAEEHLAAVQNAAPTNQVLWQSWAQLVLKEESKTKMLTTAETGLQELSYQPWDFMPIATELFIRCGQLDRATDCISKLHQKDIAPTIVTFLEGLVADREGHLFEAVRCWRRARELGNKSPQIRLALASALSRLGDAQSALRQLHTLVSERPDFFDGHLALARLLTETGNWAQAVEHAHSAMQLSPENLEATLIHLQARIQLLAAHPTDENIQMWQEIEKQLSMLEKVTDGAVEVKLLQARLAMQQGNFALAEALVTALKKAHRSQMRVVMAEVELLTAEEKEDEAILVLNKTIEEFPEAVEPVKYLAVLLVKAGNHDKCETIIKDALARNAEPVAHRELGLLLVEFYTRLGQEDDAYKFLDTLAHKFPNDIPVKRRLLGSEPVIKNPAKAQQIVNEIKSLEGKDGWQWRYEQARVWFGADDFKDLYPQIVSLLRENLLANPDDQSSRILLAATYERAGDLQVALSTYRQALSRSPQDIRIIVPTVAALYKAEEYDQAEDVLKHASQEQLYHPELQRLQLQSYLRRGQLSSASDILQDFLSNEPNNRAVCLSLALLKMQQNKFTEAGQLLDKLRLEEPNSLPVTFAQVQLNILQGKDEEALRLCNETVNNLNNVSAYILRARTFASLGQNDRAIEDFEYATAIEPNNVEVWVAMSDFYRSVGKPDKATDCIQQALSLAPNNAQIQQRAISLFLTANNLDRVRQARTILDRALESNPDDVELRVFKARSLLAEGTAPAIENAGRILQKITDDQPKIGQAWVLLGEISFQAGQFGKAIDVALRGLAHISNDESLLLLKARAEAARSPVLAIPTLKVLRELDPNDIDSTLQLASTYVAAEEPEKAVNLLRKQLSICDASTRRRCNIALAVALHKNGNKDEAQEQLDLLFQSSPDDPGPLLAQARLLKDDQLWSQLSKTVGDWYQKHPKDTHTPITIARELIATEDIGAKKTAEAILRMVLDEDLDCAEAMYALAILLQTAGRFAESAELYQQILELGHDNVIAINNLAWIMCEEQGKYQRSLELAQRGLKVAPQYIDLIDTRGVAYYRLGEFNKAIQDFTTCIKLYPSGTPSGVASCFHLGRAFAGLGERDRAIEHLNQALDLDSQIGGLSTIDLAETRRLLEELSKGG